MDFLQAPGSDIFAFFFNQCRTVVECIPVVFQVVHKKFGLHALQYIFCRGFCFCNQRIEVKNIIFPVVFLNHVPVFHLVHGRFYLLNPVACCRSHFEDKLHFLQGRFC